MIESESPPSNPIADFESFFKTFGDPPEEFKYRKKISEAYARSENYITVLFEDLLSYSPSLAHYLREHPEQALQDAVDAFKTLLRLESGGAFDFNQDYFVRISTQNNSNEVPLRQIRAKHVDKLIYVKGIVIRTSVVRPQIVEATFECQLCGTLIQESQQDSIKLKKPRECPNPSCKNKKDFRVLTEDSKFIDYQTITIQESPEELRPGAIPQTVKAVLRHNLVDLVRPGERVKIMGILKSVPAEDSRGKTSTVFKTYILVNNIEGIQQDDDELDITPQDLAEIHALSKEPDIQRKIARSIARGILGHEHLKMAAALSLFGGNQKIKRDGSRLRGDIHVLFLGDPGTGKSQILQSCAKIAPRSVYTSGKGASAAGLTAAVVRENDFAGMQLEAGALVLASGGVACIDEFDKMKSSDRVAIHEAMEQQTVSIAKAGIVATLQAKTAIIAAANPKLGRYDEYSTPSENINLSPPILSRFDLIFVVKDRPEPTNDDRIAEFILRNHMEGFDETYFDEDDDKFPKQEDYIPIDLLKKYIRHARNTCHPRVTHRAAKKIKDYYVSLRKKGAENNGAIMIVARNLDGLIRMSEAYAKMALSEFVTEEHVDAIIELVDRSMRDIGYDQETNTIDMDRLLTGTSRSKRDKLKKILQTIKELQSADPKMPLTFEDIWEPLSTVDGMTKEFLMEALEQWTRDGTLIRPRPNTYKLVNPPSKH